jgi:hypothetical protein
VAFSLVLASIYHNSALVISFAEGSQYSAVYFDATPSRFAFDKHFTESFYIHLFDTTKLAWAGRSVTNPN